MYSDLDGAALGRQSGVAGTVRARGAFPARASATPHPSSVPQDADLWGRPQPVGFSRRAVEGFTAGSLEEGLRL